MSRPASIASSRTPLGTSVLLASSTMKCIPWQLYLTYRARPEKPHRISCYFLCATWVICARADNQGSKRATTLHGEGGSGYRDYINGKRSKECWRLGFSVQRENPIMRTICRTIEAILPKFNTSNVTRCLLSLCKQKLHTRPRVPFSRYRLPNFHVQTQ